MYDEEDFGEQGVPKSEAREKVSSDKEEGPVRMERRGRLRK